MGSIHTIYYHIIGGAMDIKKYINTMHTAGLYHSLANANSLLAMHENDPEQAMLYDHAYKECKEQYKNCITDAQNIRRKKYAY